jgi:hypothetical protein
MFILGFLLSGVISDHKEGERLPLEISASIYAIADECMFVYQSKKAEEAKGFL